ncbi:hypothetical protein DEM27_06510 [Metarhizobium album]|uniref:Uncharacterized protein n=1 Tax=Metarhizobium album TaxID=2182425 RepID=A0A2U2DVD8_9HYPH|nr:hypothetical protein [Rhizobium album]PWE57285.1 hypothetical protein DEM27_06510 [Rhizobium album]
MRIFAALVFSIIWSGSAAAQWYYQGEESAFGAGGTHIALAANGRYGFGIRCQNGDLNFVFITPEEISTDQATVLSSSQLKLLLRVDDMPANTLAGVADSSDGKLRVTAVASADEVGQIRDAKKRLAVAASIGTEVFHEIKFTSRGSTKVIEKVLSGCGVR